MTENVDSYEVKTVYFTNYPLKHPAAYRRSRGNTEECCRLAVARAKGLGTATGYFYIEENVWVTESGGELLSSSVPRELREI